MIARVADSGTVSEAFEVINGMKQGCVLAPTVFILMFSAMPMNVYPDEHPGILIVYRTDGHLNSRHMQALTRLSTTTVQDLLSAADCALKTATEADTQCSMNFFTSGCAKFGPTSNAAKTVAMYQPSSNAAFSIYQIHVNDTQLKTVNNFAYLGSTLSHSVKVDSEVAYWIFKGRLGATVNQPEDLGRPSTEQTGQMKTVSAMDGANRIAAAKGKRESLQASGVIDPQRRHPIPTKMPALSTNVPRLVEHIRSECANSPTTRNAASYRHFSNPTISMTSINLTNNDHNPGAPPPSVTAISNISSTISAATTTATALTLVIG
ncbi:hypothetical protein SprV_0100129600 [Sparganum proliferum]